MTFHSLPRLCLLFAALAGSIAWGQTRDITELLRENWAALQAERQQLERDFATLDNLKAKLPAGYDKMLADGTKGLDNYEQRLYELRREVPADTIDFLEGRTDARPAGDNWNKMLRGVTTIKAALASLREKTFVTPFLQSARTNHGADGIAMLRTHVPTFYDTYVEGRLRLMREILASDQAPYGASTREGWSLVTDLGWDHEEAFQLYSLAVCRRWFGPGHDDLVPQVAAVMRHANSENMDAVITGMEELRKLDVGTQPGFLQSLLGAYRDDGRSAEADQIVAQLIEQNDPLAIRMRLDQKPPARENRSLLQRLADASQISGPEAWTLANYWATGEAGPRDPAVASRLKAIALDKQYPMACHDEALRLSKLPASQVDQKRYRELLEISWRHGYTDIASLLYNAAYDSQGRAKSTKLNQSILLAAADQGNKTAIMAVGYNYMNGTDGFARDPQRALPWLQKASANGYNAAPAYLGVIYLYGQTGTANLREAHAQFRRARDLGHWQNPAPHVISSTVIAALEKQVACGTCKGAGKHTGYRTCNDCRGRGSYRCDKCNGRGTTKEYYQEYCRAGCRGGYISWQRQTGTNSSGYPIYKTERQRCTSCGGRGSWSASKDVRCRSCGGDGERRCSDCRGKGEIETSGSCRDCGGDGKIIRYDSKQAFSPAEL